MIIENKLVKNLKKIKKIENLGKKLLLFFLNMVLFKNLN